MKCELIIAKYKDEDGSHRGWFEFLYVEMKGNQCAINSARFTATASRSSEMAGRFTGLLIFSVLDDPTAIHPENYFNLLSVALSVPRHIICIDTPFSNSLTSAQIYLSFV